MIGVLIIYVSIRLHLFHAERIVAFPWQQLSEGATYHIYILRCLILFDVNLRYIRSVVKSKSTSTNYGTADSEYFEVVSQNSILLEGEGAVLLCATWLQG